MCLAMKPTAHGETSKTGSWKMKTEMLTRVRKHYCHDMAPVNTQRHNIRQWVRSVRMLGDKWLLAKQIGRIA